MIEIDSASLREINRKYDGNRVEIVFAAPAYRRPWRLCSLPRRITGCLVFLFSQRRRDAKELKGLSLISCISVLASCYLILVTFLMSNPELRLKDFEIEKYNVPGTCLRQAGKVQSRNTKYGLKLMSNTERRMLS